MPKRVGLSNGETAEFLDEIREIYATLVTNPLRVTGICRKQPKEGKAILRPPAYYILSPAAAARLPYDWKHPCHDCGKPLWVGDENVLDLSGNPAPCTKWQKIRQKKRSASPPASPAWG